MKIVVQNEKEKDLLKRFIKALVMIDGIDEVEKVDHEIGNPEEFYVNSDEYRLLREEFGCVKIHIDENSSEMSFDDSSVITGFCKECGAFTEGTIDGDPVTYSEYLNYQSKEQRENWKCESCFLKTKIEV